MPVYLFSPEFDVERINALERKIRAVIPDLIRLGRVEELARIQQEHEGQNFVLLVSFAKDCTQLANLVDAALRQDAGVVPIVVSDEISASDYKRLTRAGSVDWVSTAAMPHDIVEVLTRHRARSQGSKERPLPVVASFLPCAGGVGNSMLAVQTAVHLKTAKATARRTICIVDLDFQTSHVCDYLDIEPRFHIEEISNSPERLDDQLLDIYISRDQTGLHVLAAPRTKFNICELNVSALDTLFDMISARYDLIVIDIPPIWFGWTSRILAGSDGVVMTGTNTVVSLRQMVETLAAIKDCKHPAAPLAVVLNRCERTLLGAVARRRHVEKVLGDQTVFYVREEPLMLQSVNTGTPLALSRSARNALRDIAAIADFCAGLKSTRPAAASGRRN